MIEKSLKKKWCSIYLFIYLIWSVNGAVINLELFKTGTQAAGHFPLIDFIQLSHMGNQTEYNPGSPKSLKTCKKLFKNL